MTKQVETREEAQKQLWAHLDEGRVAMLWVNGSDQHPQPMTIFADQEESAIWFITSSDTDLAVAVGSGASAQMTFVSSKQDYHASLRGNLEIVRDRSDKLDDLWSVPVAAWFEGGREDATVRLMKFTPADAAIWASESNMILVGLKLLRKGLTEGQGHPDVGVHHAFSFSAAA